MFHKNLKRLRTRRKLSQEDMATYLGITRQGYSKYENDKSEPSLQMLMRIADLFEVSIDELIGYSSNVDAPSSTIEEANIFNQLGVDQEDYDNLTPYQQEVLDWAINEDALFFKNKSDNVLDMMDRLEIAYEVNKAIEKREKNNKSK